MSGFSRHERDGSVPTILEAFPIPPSHIPSKPPTPLTPVTPHPTHPNPPPSRPPSFPLPPLPGPSRISEHDLILLSSANSRPASKYSTISDAKRDSVASSSSSGHSVRASVVSVSNSTPRRSPSVTSSSSRSIRSGPPIKFPSAASRPSISFPISEESGDVVEPHHQSLTRLAISPMPLSDDDYDVATSPPLSRHRHRHNDSISSIDMRDLPAADDDEQDPSIPPFNAFRTLSRPPNQLTITVPPPNHHVSLADPIDPHTITVEDRQPLDHDGVRPPASPPLPSGQSTTLEFGMLSSAPFEPTVSPLPSKR